MSKQDGAWRLLHLSKWEKTEREERNGRNAKHPDLGERTGVVVDSLSTTEEEGVPEMTSGFWREHQAGWIPLPRMERAGGEADGR